MKKITCEEFDTLLWNEGFYSDIHSEMSLNDSFNSDKILDLFKIEAKKRNYLLLDLKDFDYEKVFWNNYKNDDDKRIS